MPFPGPFGILIELLPLLCPPLSRRFRLLAACRQLLVFIVGRLPVVSRMVFITASPLLFFCTCSAPPHDFLINAHLLKRKSVKIVSGQRRLRQGEIFLFKKYVLEGGEEKMGLNTEQNFELGMAEDINVSIVFRYLMRKPIYKLMF